MSYWSWMVRDGKTSLVKLGTEVKSEVGVVQWGLCSIGLAGWGEGHLKGWLGWTVSFFGHHAKEAGGIIWKTRTHQGKSTLMTGQFSVCFFPDARGFFFLSLVSALSPRRLQNFWFAFKLIVGFPTSSAGKKTHLQCRRPWFHSRVGKILQRRGRLSTPVFLGFPGGSAGKESAHSAGNMRSFPGLGRFPWRRERPPTPVFWPGVFSQLYSPWSQRVRHGLNDFHF